MIKQLIGLIFLIFAFSNTYSQVKEFTAPVKLPSQINSKSEELYPMLSADGKTLYFSRAFDSKNVGGEYAGLDIWYSTKTNGQWGEATNNFETLNNKDNNAVLGIKADGQTTYLLNSYSRKDGIAFSKKVKDEWIKPEPIDIPGVDKNNLMGCYMAPTYDVMILSLIENNGYGQEDLYVSELVNGKWTKPENLGATINTSGFEISPFLSPDKKRLYFASDGHPGMGEADLFMAEKQYDSWSVWSKPINLKVLNSDKFDAYLTISNDSVAFFSSNRGGGYSDIYHSKIQEAYSQDSISILLAETKKMLDEINPESNYNYIVCDKPLINNSTKEAERASLKKFFSQFAGLNITVNISTKNDSYEDQASYQLIKETIEADELVGKKRVINKVDPLVDRGCTNIKVTLTK